MFIVHIAGKSSLAPEERNVLLSEAKCFAPPELQSCLGSWFYKHLVPLGPKTYHLDGINDALAALAAGEGARGIIRW
jgi:hypothetical protein